MKNLQELTLEAKDIQKQLDKLKPQHISSDMAEYKKLRRQLDFVSLCVKYLETNPTEESVLRQLNDELRKLEITDARFETWLVNEGYKRIHECAKEVVSKKRAEYNSMMGVADMKRKIKMLEFLEPQQQISI